MSETVISVHSLSKRYRIGAQQPAYRTLRDQLNEKALAPFRAARHFFKSNGNGNGNSGSLGAHSSSTNGRSDTIWALKDVSFEVECGEVVGVIGRNGAGKSTLLKILSRITEPTEGYADITGRIASLLEVGTGFHAELTGRENIYLNGSILGMRRAEIQGKFNEIVDFAEIGKFIDTPVKYYSSGMYVRLAFAVAAHLDPEILLVDEVLAVGDAAFQKKCLGKISDVAKGGRTVLFVSHNMAAVQSLCSRGVLLDQGKISYVGNVSDCVAAYTDFGCSSHAADVDLSSHAARERGKVPLLKRVRLLDAAGRVSDRFMCGEMMRIELTCEPSLALRNPEFTIGINDWLHTRVFSVTSYFSESELPAFETECRVICDVEAVPLAPGRYTLCLSAGTFEQLWVDHLEDAVSFDIDAGNFYGNGRVPDSNYGRVLMKSRWQALDA
jgi:homopolymeric O-antigen transport system ATP-binding protein